MARKAHPNLFDFIEVIQKEQAAAEVTIEQLLLDAPSRAICGWRILGSKVNVAQSLHALAFGPKEADESDTDKV